LLCESEGGGKGRGEREGERGRRGEGREGERGRERKEGQKDEGEGEKEGGRRKGNGLLLVLGCTRGYSHDTVIGMTNSTVACGESRDIGTGMKINSLWVSHDIRAPELGQNNKVTLALREGLQTVI